MPLSLACYSFRHTRLPVSNQSISLWLGIFEQSWEWIDREKLIAEKLYIPYFLLVLCTLHTPHLWLWWYYTKQWKYSNGEVFVLEQWMPLFSSCAVNTGLKNWRTSAALEVFIKHRFVLSLNETHSTLFHIASEIVCSLHFKSVQNSLRDNWAIFGEVLTFKASISVCNSVDPFNQVK